MREWLTLEKRLGQSFEKQLVICEAVIDGKSYAEAIRNEFRARKATVLYFKGRDRSSSDAFDLFAESLALHVQAYEYFWKLGRDADWNYKKVRNTAYVLISTAQQIGFDQQLVKVFRSLCRQHGVLSDPLFEPMKLLASFLGKSREGEPGKRRYGLLHGLKFSFEKREIAFARDDRNAALEVHLQELLSA